MELKYRIAPVASSKKVKKIIEALEGLDRVGIKNVKVEGSRITRILTFETPDSSTNEDILSLGVLIGTILSP